jgi:hypothetical protein
MSWEPEQLVWPWTPEETLKGSKADRRVVLAKLAERNFPIKQMGAKKPVDSIVNGATAILTRMLNYRESGEQVPWMVLLSSSVPVMQALATLSAMTYSLTTTGSCAMTDTSKLVELFFHRHADDAFQSDPAADLLYEIKVAGFLVWEGVTGSVSGSAHQAGRFENLLEYRLRHKLLTLFTAPYVSVKPETRKRLIAQIENALGSGVAAMLDSEASLLNIRVKEETKKAYGELEV